MKEVGVFAATRWEVNAVRQALRVDGVRRGGGVRCVLGRRGNCRVWLFRMGVGPERSAAVCREALAGLPLDVAVSAGFACALIPCQVGDLLVGTHVLAREAAPGSHEASEVLACSGALTQKALDASHRANLRAHAGLFVTVPQVVWRAREKQEIACATGAIALDMESAAVARAARERRIGCVIVRAASDLVDEDLPLDFNLFLTPRGWLRGISHCLVRPSSLAGLRRLGAQSARASDQLTTFFGEFLDCFEQGLPAPSPH